MVFCGFLSFMLIRLDDNDEFVMIVALSLAAAPYADVRCWNESRMDVNKL